MNVKLGHTVRDRLTGFSGVVTGLCAYITGCNQALVTPRVVEGGKYPEPHWFDEQRLEVCKVDVFTIDNGSTPGPDMPAPMK